MAHCAQQYLGQILVTTEQLKVNFTYSCYFYARPIKVGPNSNGGLLNRNSQFGTNNPWKFLAHTLITQHKFLWICFLCRWSFLLIKLGISKLGCIVRPHRFFLERRGRGWERKFQLPPPEGVNSHKIKKGGGGMVQAQAFLKKEGEEHFSYLIFSRFIIFTFRNYFILCKILLCIWRIKKLSATIILRKKVIR